MIVKTSSENTILQWHNWHWLGVIVIHDLPACEFRWIIIKLIGSYWMHQHASHWPWAWVGVFFRCWHVALDMLNVNHPRSAIERPTNSLGCILSLGLRGRVLKLWSLWAHTQLNTTLWRGPCSPRIPSHSHLWTRKWTDKWSFEINGYHTIQCISLSKPYDYCMTILASGLCSYPSWRRACRPTDLWSWCGIHPRP